MRKSGDPGSGGEKECDRNSGIGLRTSLCNETARTGHMEEGRARRYRNVHLLTAIITDEEQSRLGR